MTKNIQGISVRTHLKAGGLSANHNERLVREAAGRGLRVRTQLKAGGGGLQNNEALVRDRREGRR